MFDYQLDLKLVTNQFNHYDNLFKTNPTNTVAYNKRKSNKQAINRLTKTINNMAIATN